MEEGKLCRHFGVCGGCRWQDVTYEEQVRRKQEHIVHLMKEASLKADIKEIRCFEPWFYRNKMEFTFSYDEGRLICGLHRRDDKRKVFNLEECRIFSPIAGKILSAVRAWAEDEGYVPYNKFSHRGLLRHLVIRETKFTGEVMVALVTTSERRIDKESFVDMLCTLDIDKKLVSIQWVLNDSFGDAVVFQKKELLYGEPFITEQIGALKLRIYINSFFQTNARGIGTLYGTIKDAACLSGGENVLDLYSGIGSIALFLADRAKFVWGVEVVEEAVRNAEENASLNGIRNVSFIHEDVRRFLGIRNLKAEIDRVVVNPPRSGLSGKVKQRVVKLEAPFIFYSSCNPQTFVSDLRDMTGGGAYRIESIEPFDFFPHTPHMEVLALLVKHLRQ